VDACRDPNQPSADPRKEEGWVRRVRETSDAMDLPVGLFTQSPRRIARGLKGVVSKSTRIKGTKFQSAMSMLNLFINRAGRTLIAPGSGAS